MDDVRAEVCRDVDVSDPTWPSWKWRVLVHGEELGWGRAMTRGDAIVLARQAVAIVKSGEAEWKDVTLNDG